MEGTFVFTKAIAPVLAAVTLIAFIGEGVMAQGVFTAETVLPKLDKLDPVQGFKNLFSKRQLVELLKSILKMVVVSWITYLVLKDEIASLLTMLMVDADKSGYATAVLAGRLAVKVSLLYAGLGIADALYQWRQYIKDMMMTREEVKQEYKQSEGDPHHKAARKQLHQEILQHQMVQEVKSADVVVTNPDHIAVAIKYDKDSDRAPKVIAKGQRVIAEQIKQIAKENNIPIMRNVPLAHALMRVELGDEIPEELYDAVAEVLNWVYSLAEKPDTPPPAPKMPNTPKTPTKTDKKRG
jgi:flagellar biosynthetic protein FlhB